MKYSGKKWVSHSDARPIFFGYFGFGVAYPDFKAENPAQTVTSFGGLIFMIICTGYIGLVILKVRSEILPLDG